MAKRNRTSRPVVGCALLSLSTLAVAQTQSPPGVAVLQSRQEAALIAAGEPEQAKDKKTEKEAADKPQENAANGFFFAGSGVFNAVQSSMRDGQKLVEQMNEQQEKLRQQLADPKQRAKLHAERVEMVRRLNPEMARVLRLDEKTEESLLSVLTDQYLDREVSNPFRSTMSFGRDASRASAPNDFNKDQASIYTRQMEQISKVIGAAQIDAYVDYQKSLPGRMRVQQFDSTLSAENKLQPDQKDTMAGIFTDSMQRQVQGFRFGGQMLSTLRETPEEQQRRRQILTLSLNENQLIEQEAANRDLDYRLAPLLTPEQAKAFTMMQEGQLQARRNWAQQMRRDLGLAPDDKIESFGEPLAPAPLLSSNVQLDIKLSINDVEISKTLISKRGATLSFAAPEGLQVEVRPYLAGSDAHLMLDLNLYETVRGGRRLVGQLGMSTLITNPRKGPAPQASSFGGGGGTVAQGRKGYAVNWSVNATYL